MLNLFKDLQATINQLANNSKDGDRFNQLGKSLVLFIFSSDIKYSARVPTAGNWILQQGDNLSSF